MILGDPTAPTGYRETTPEEARTMLEARLRRHYAATSRFLGVSRRQGSIRRKRRLAQRLYRAWVDLDADALGNVAAVVGALEAAERLVASGEPIESVVDRLLAGPEGWQGLRVVGETPGPGPE